MKEKIYKLLESRFQGARKDGLEIIANTLSMVAADDENAKKMVEGMTEDQVKEFISNHRKTADAEITKATKTAEENLRKKFDFVEKGGEPKKDPKPEDEKETKEQPDIKALIAEAIAPYKSKLEEFEAGNVKKARRGQFDEAVKAAPESIRKLMAENFEGKSFADDAEFNTYLEAVKGQAAEYEKEFNAFGLRNLGAPERATGNADGVSAAAKAYIEKKHKTQTKN